MNQNQLAEIVHFHRKKSGLSQAALARLAGLGKTVIFDVEHGKQSVRWETIVKILEVLNIKMEFKSPLMELFRTQFDEKS